MIYLETITGRGKRAKKSLMIIRLKNGNTHKNYIFRGGITAKVQFIVIYFSIDII
jgi:hypothetical protein